jgi:hypothetical protein
MPIKYFVNKNLSLLYTLFYDEVNLDDCRNYVISLFNDPDVHNTTRTLAYLKDSTLIFKVEEVEEFASLIANNSTFKLREKLAILIDKPTDTVAATIYAQALSESARRIKTELFYTLDAALLFLDLLEQKDDVNKLIYEEISNLNS